MKIAPVRLPVSDAENTLLLSFKRAVDVEWLGVNPDWNDDRILLILKYW